MNTAGYILVAVGLALLLIPTGAVLRLLLGSGLRVLVWAAIWLAMAGGGVKILNRYPPADVYYSLEQFVNPMLALLSWLVAYPLCLLLDLSLQINEELTRIFISMTGTLAFWRIIIYDNVAGDGITHTTSMGLTFVLCLLLTVRPRKKFATRLL